jgi:hypothetical protein
MRGSAPDHGQLPQRGGLDCDLGAVRAVLPFGVKEVLKQPCRSMCGT